ncbi:MAG: hypothetical protein II707_11150 [Spirochaetales bacterium]|nr:hypothetical protein [Spirochaetales bacterium]
MPYEMIAKEVRTLTYEEQLNLMSILVEAMKTAMKNRQSIHSENKKNFQDSYPKGYFDLFGSDPTFFDEPEDIPANLDEMPEFC